MKNMKLCIEYLDVKPLQSSNISKNTKYINFLSSSSYFDKVSQL